jgi:hypothetical protein
MFKKKMSKEDAVDMLLEIRSRIEKLTIKAFHENLNYNGDEKKLQYEAMIFSLWLITLSLPSRTYRIKKMLHYTFSWEYSGIKDNDQLFEEIYKRYDIYHGAFDIWKKDRQQDKQILGAVMVEIMKNQNSDFSLDEITSLVDPVEASKAFILFSSLVKLIVVTIREDIKL